MAKGNPIYKDTVFTQNHLPNVAVDGTLGNGPAYDPVNNVITAPSGGGSTLVIATSDATAQEKAIANWVLGAGSGSAAANSAIIQAANDTAGLGVVRILGKTAYFTSLIIDNCDLRGSGVSEWRYGTVLTNDQAAGGIVVKGGGRIHDLVIKVTAAFAGVALTFGADGDTINSVPEVADNITCYSDTATQGTGIRIFTDGHAGDSYIMFTRFGKFTVIGFQYGVKMETISGGGHLSFISACTVENLVLYGNQYGLVVSGVSDITFHNISLQPGSVTPMVDGITLSCDHCKILACQSWDWQLATGKALKITGGNGNQISGYLDSIEDTSTGTNIIHDTYNKRFKTSNLVAYSSVIVDDDTNAAAKALLKGIGATDLLTFSDLGAVLTDVSGTSAGGPTHNLVTGGNTINITADGTFTVTIPRSIVGTVSIASGTATVTGGPIYMYRGEFSKTFAVTGSPGSITITISYTTGNKAKSTSANWTASGGATGFPITRVGIANAMVLSLDGQRVYKSGYDLRGSWSMVINTIPDFNSTDNVTKELLAWDNGTDKLYLQKRNNASGNDLHLRWRNAGIDLSINMVYPFVTGDHLCLVITHDDSTNTTLLYCNGVRLGSSAAMTAFGNTATLILGGQGTYGYWTGKILAPYILAPYVFTEDDAKRLTKDCMAMSGVDFLAPGEIRTIAYQIKTTTLNAYNSFTNRFSRDCMVLDATVRVVTPGAAGSHIKVGIGNSATADYTTLFDNITADVAGFYNCKVAPIGQMTQPQLLENKVTGVNKYINFSIKDVAATNMIAYYYITVMGL